MTAHSSKTRRFPVFVRAAQIHDFLPRLHDDHTRTFNVSLNMDYKSALPYFDFDTMIPPWTMARAIAKETWSREYFETLKAYEFEHPASQSNVNSEFLELTLLFFISGRTRRTTSSTATSP